MAITEREFDQACQFIIELGTLGHRYGLPSYYLEYYLARFVKQLGCSGYVMATPKWLNFVLWRSGDKEQYHYFVPLPEVSYNLAKLSQVGQLIRQFKQGQVPIAEMKPRLNQIDEQPPQYGIAPVALGYALSGAGFAVLLSVVWRDVLLAGMLSLVTYWLVLQAGHWPWLAHRLEITIALVVALLANSIALLVLPGSNTFYVTLCALIVLIPGLPLSLGVGEILAKSFLSGMSRLIDGILITIKLYLGAFIGPALVNAVHPVPAAATAAMMSFGVQWLSVLVLIFGLGLVFQVHPHDLSWAILAGAMAYGGSQLGGQWGIWQGSFLGALFLGCYADLFAWAKQRPSTVVLLPGIMILVPGAAAYLGIETLETEGLTTGLIAIAKVVEQIIAIVGGLIVASSLVPNTLKSAKFAAQGDKAQAG